MPPVAVWRKVTHNLTPKQQFVTALNKIAGDIRFFWMPDPANNRTTSVGSGANPAPVITWDATVAARISAQGKGFIQTFDGSANYGTTPSLARYSFGGSGAGTDTPFSIVALCNTTSTAVRKLIVSKFNNTALASEWELYVEATTNTLIVLMRDESVPVVSQRFSDATITTGSLHLLGMTYTAAQGGGATNMNDVTLYQDGAVIASTVGNQATYVAMEPLASPIEIGTDTAHTLRFFAGSMGFVMVTAHALTLAEHKAVKGLVNNYFGLGL